MMVKIISDGTPHGTKVTDKDGRELDWLCGVAWRCELDDVARADLVIGHIEAEIDAVATFWVKGKPVRRIEYADGTVDEFPGE